MKVKKYIIGAVVIIGILILSVLMHSKPKTVHFHAGFLVYIDGSLQNFSDGKYMKIEPCATNEADIRKDDQLEKAHLHGGTGDVIHVHRTGALWGDVFKNIHFTLPKDKSITGFVNGAETSSILRYPIRPYDSVVIAVGNRAGIDVLKRVTREHIMEVEKKVETCGV